MEKKPKKEKKIKFELTEEEALQLLHVSGNGYGNGDFFKGGGYGTKEDEKIYLRAYKKIAQKLNLDTRP